MKNCDLIMNIVQKIYIMILIYVSIIYYMTATTSGTSLSIVCVTGLYINAIQTMLSCVDDDGFYYNNYATRKVELKKQKKKSKRNARKRKQNEINIIYISYIIYA